ncbi:MAG: DUF2442 domain-containing protein [Candidatus Omnitrophica bacterium]|nr:DUF2442 domain-containing protein [Candidatus Omnitrophota bacterium]
MYYDVKSAQYCDGYKILLSFADGKGGIVDFQPYLQKGGVFEKFKDLNFFKNFHINEEVGVLSWENDIDIAPETIYSKATKLPIPQWVA